MGFQAVSGCRPTPLQPGATSSCAPKLQTEQGNLKFVVSSRKRYYCSNTDLYSTLAFNCLFSRQWYDDCPGPIPLVQSSLPETARMCSARGSCGSISTARLRWTSSTFTPPRRSSFVASCAHLACNCNAPSHIVARVVTECHAEPSRAGEFRRLSPLAILWPVGRREENAGACIPARSLWARHRENAS